MNNLAATWLTAAEVGHKSTVVSLSVHCLEEAGWQRELKQSAHPSSSMMHAAQVVAPNGAFTGMLIQQQLLVIQALMRSFQIHYRCTVDQTWSVEVPSNPAVQSRSSKNYAKLVTATEIRLVVEFCAPFRAFNSHRRLQLATKIADLCVSN